MFFFPVSSTKEVEAIGERGNMGWDILGLLLYSGFERSYVKWVVKTLVRGEWRD